MRKSTIESIRPEGQAPARLEGDDVRPGTPVAGAAGRSLRRFNLGMGGLHLVQGIAILPLSTSFALPVTTPFLQMRGPNLVPARRTLGEIPIGSAVAAFLFLSAISHLAVSSRWGFRRYVADLGRGMNRARWIEYSLSSSLMIVVIAMLVGIYDIVSLLALFALNACMILFGWIMEVHNQTTSRTNWLSYWFGVFAGTVPWIAIGIYLFGPTASGDPGPPTFVYAIFGSIFVFFNIFAVNMVLQYRRVGPWRGYLYGERAYVWLSLVAKSLLAWQVFAGTLRPN
jgi:hypothetical protein